MKQSLHIIKVGGNILDDESKLNLFLEAFAAIKGNKILVHGGGKLATQMAEKLGIPQKLVEGRRITDAETLKLEELPRQKFDTEDVIELIVGIVPTPIVVVANCWQPLLGLIPITVYVVLIVGVVITSEPFAAIGFHE